MNNCARILFALTVVFAAFCFSKATAYASVVTYNPNDPSASVQVPVQIPASPNYTVSVSQDGGTAQDSFVYYTKNFRAGGSGAAGIYEDDTSWSTFSFSGPVTVTVTSLLPGGISTCEILPARLGITPTFTPGGDTVTFTIDNPAKLSVEINGMENSNTGAVSIKNPLLIFADELEQDVPSPTDPDVIYIGPGYHSATTNNEDSLGRPILDTTVTASGQPSGQLHINPGQTVYIAGGAFVHGYINESGKTDITIRGRGILSGAGYNGDPFYPHKYQHSIQIVNPGVTNTKIEGITIADSSWTNMRLTGTNNYVHNVKAISWFFNTDGLLLGGNSTVENSFFKVNDDTIKLYASNMTARNIVIWQEVNGAPMQLSWNVSSPISNNRVSHVDIIRCEHVLGNMTNQTKGIFNSVHGGIGLLSDFVFDDFTIDNADGRLFQLWFVKTSYNVNQTGGGNIRDITFRNIKVFNKMTQPSIVNNESLSNLDTSSYGFDRIRFENVSVQGVPLSLETFNFTPNSTQNSGYTTPSNFAKHFSAYTFIVGDNVNPTALTAGQQLTAQVSLRNGTAVSQDYVVILALYDSGGNMVNSSQATAAVAGNSISQDLALAGFTLPADTTGMSAKLMVWNGSDAATATMVPPFGAAAVFAPAQ
jgi:hypothetical protein